MPGKLKGKKSNVGGCECLPELKMRRDAVASMARNVLSDIANDPRCPIGKDRKEFEQIKNNLEAAIGVLYRQGK